MNRRNTGSPLFIQASADAFLCKPGFREGEDISDEARHQQGWPNHDAGGWNGSWTKKYGDTCSMKAISTKSEGDRQRSSNKVSRSNLMSLRSVGEGIGWEWSLSD